MDHARPLLQDRPDGVREGSHPAAHSRRWQSRDHVDVETGEEFWVSGVKKDGTDRHWAGSGAVEIDDDVRAEYERLLDR